MRKWTLGALLLSLCLVVGFGCTRATGGGEARYLTLFASAWQHCHSLGLYEVRVAAVTALPDGNKRVVVNYLYNNGMVPDQGRAAMLVNPQGRLASDCILDLDANICLCDARKDWHDGP